MKARKITVTRLMALVLLALLVLLLWFMNNDAWLKGKIESSVSELTGRTLSIDGALDLDWSLNPVLKAGECTHSVDAAAKCSWSQT